MPPDARLPTPTVRTPRRIPAPIENLRRRLRALGEAWWRTRAQRAQADYCGTFIAVTGSCGKTTTTLLVERLLAASGAAVAGGRNENHGRHLMKTMARLSRRVDFVVQEVSGHRPGAIADITDHLRVDVAVVTVVGYDHSSAFGVAYGKAPDAIAAEKGRLVEALPSDGIACLNADDPRVAAMAGRTTGRLVTYGRAAGAELRATSVQARWPHRLAFDLEVGGRVFAVATRFVGTIMLPNVLAALSVIHAVGLDLSAAIAALASVEPERLHMSIYEGGSGRTYVLDTFKAPFWSTEMLVADLADIGGSGTLFVLGDMSDIRNDSSRRYTAVIRRAVAAADRVALIGKAVGAGTRIRHEGARNVELAADLPALARLIADSPERLVILKANSKQHLEQVVALAEAAASETMGGQHA